MVKYHRIIVPYERVLTISPEQYERLKSEGYKVHGNGTVKTVYTDRLTAQVETPEAKMYTHNKFHQEYPTAKCFYTDCEK